MITNLFFYFFFQAEDGIRDVAVTGVQTCALPIWLPARRLPLIARLQWLLADQVERLEHGPVAEPEKDRLTAFGRVLVPRPRRHDERIALGPVEALPGDDAVPATLGHVIDGACGVAVRLRVLALADELQVRAHRRQRRTTRIRIDVLEHDAVERAAGVVAKSL